MIKIFKNVFFITFLYILSYLVPKNKKLILLGSGFGTKFMGNSKYFYLWLIRKKAKSLNYIWITRNKKILNDLKKKKYPVVFLYSLRGLWCVLRAKVLIVEQSSKDIIGTGFVIGNYNILNTMHGTPLKMISIDEQVKNATMIEELFKIGINIERKKYTMLACSTENARNLKKSLHNGNIKVLGYPRNDVFFDKNLCYIDYNKKLNLKKYKKVLLYAPTLRDHKALTPPFSQNFLIKLNNYLRVEKSILLIRTHPLAVDKIEFNNLSNMLNISRSIDDIQEILLYTDVLITDYSSIIYEYALTKKPIIFYPFDYKDYIENCRKMYLDYYKELPGPFANNEDELLNYIKNVNVWKKKADYKRKYDLFMTRFNKYRDGKSSERIYNFLQNYVKNLS